jgi:tetratricopeptide (TPR) repeat protein
MHILKTALATIAFVAMQLISPAQSALQKKHEDELAQAGQKLNTVQAGANADDAAKATALREKAMALGKLGRSAEALEIIRQAEKLAPGDPGVQMHAAIILDMSGDHQAARAKYDKLLDDVHAWHAERAAILKKGDKPAATPADIAMLAVGLAAPQNSALNYVFINNYARAAAQFTRDYETNLRTFGANDDSDYDACWLLWLAAKSRAADGMRADVAIETLAGTLVVASPYHQEMLKLWRGKGTWQAILAAIEGMDIPDVKKETCRTGAHFFAAGYFRYMKNDNQTALELLEAENARSFNGCVERLFVRREIAELRVSPK